MAGERLALERLLRQAAALACLRLRRVCVLSRVTAALLLGLSAPAFAQADEIQPVPAQALTGHPYFSEIVPSRILFINVRDRPVRIFWVGFDGKEMPYGDLEQGQQRLQPTYVAHRWVVRDAADGTPLVGFISTRAATRSGGTSQIALIR
jgi:hypothetical protein